MVRQFRFGILSMTLLTLAFVALAVWRFYAMNTSAQLEVDAPASQSNRNPQTALVKELSQQHLFGLPQRPQPRQPKAVRTNLSPLSVQITGVIVADAGASVVSLKHSGITESVKEGDYLNMSDLVKVKQINSDQVVFERDGQEQTVELKPRQMKQRIVALNAGDVKTIQVRDLQQPSLFNRAMQEIKRTPQRISYYFQIDSLPEGLRLSPGKDPRLFTLLPLQLGDTLVSVNNKPLSGLSEQDFARLLVSEQQLVLELVRDEQSQTLQLVLN